jgi:sporulation protein YlmC with PRC-barrel domain
MKIRISNMTPWLAALICLTLAPAIKAADEVEPPMAPTPRQTAADPKSDEQGMEPSDKPAHGSHEMSAETQSSEAPPARVNKASGILGMDVRNPNDEHLGHIKDIVFDWKTEQISYAVLSTAPKTLLGLGGKLLAVPLTALTPSGDQKYLILNAEKSKLEAAMGFDSANWPGVSNPSWGAEPFWQKQTTTPPMSDQPAKESDPKMKGNITPGDSSATEPESSLGEEPGVAPDRDSPAKPDAAPESKSQSDSKSDSATKDNAKPDQDPEAAPNQTPDGK